MCSPILAGWIGRDSTLYSGLKQTRFCTDIEAKSEYFCNQEYWAALKYLAGTKVMRAERVSRSRFHSHPVQWSNRSRD
jgi:hypothetical protein